ncbi:MAG: hypothetical protein MR936_04170 [Eubacterium sp.]|nr:hypothetical protein [Eubacterium sp.]
MEHEKYVIYQNENGPDIGTVSAPVLQVDGLYFKDLAGKGELLPYEDWRLDADTRARNLASRLGIEKIAGLMMYPIRWFPLCREDLFPLPMMENLSLRAEKKNGI